MKFKKPLKLTLIDNYISEHIFTAPSLIVTVDAIKIDGKCKTGIKLRVLDFRKPTFIDAGYFVEFESIKFGTTI